MKHVCNNTGLLPSPPACCNYHQDIMGAHPGAKPKTLSCCGYILMIILCGSFELRTQESKKTFFPPWIKQYQMGPVLWLSITREQAPCFCDSMSMCFCVCVCFVDTERGEWDVYGGQTLCLREPHPPGELCKRTGWGGLESWTGEGHSLHFLQ